MHFYLKTQCRYLGNLYWQNPPPETCPSASYSPCRPTSSGRYQDWTTGNPWPGSPFVVCDKADTNC